jgi:hypothetical protein
MSVFEPCTTPAAKRRHWVEVVQPGGFGVRYGMTLSGNRAMTLSGNRAMPIFFPPLLPCKQCDKAKAAREREEAAP